MSFLQPCRIPGNVVRGHKGCGGIATNVDGTLFASVDNDQHCVYLCTVGADPADAVVFGTVGTSGSINGQLSFPAYACFVHRDGIDTLLICDTGNNRVVEVSVCGVFLRAIAVDAGSPYGIAYCNTAGGVIAVTLYRAHSVVVLQYESGVVNPEVTIGSRQLFGPIGISFTLDGRFILVADYLNHRVSKFSAASGAFVAHVVTRAAISYPRDVLQCEDGSILVAQGSFYPSVVCVSVDGVKVDEFITPSASTGRDLIGRDLISYSLSHSTSFNCVLVKCLDGGVFGLRDAWSHSSRCAFLHACVRV